MEVEAAKDGSIIVRSAIESVGFNELGQYAGSIDMTKTVWGQQGIDATEWIRHQRDEEWR